MVNGLYWIIQRGRCVISGIERNGAAKSLFDVALVRENDDGDDAQALFSEEVGGGRGRRMMVNHQTSVNPRGRISEGQRLPRRTDFSVEILCGHFVSIVTSQRGYVNKIVASGSKLKSSS